MLESEFPKIEYINVRFFKTFLKRPLNLYHQLKQRLSGIASIEVRDLLFRIVPSTTRCAIDGKVESIFRICLVEIRLEVDGVAVGFVGFGLCIRHGDISSITARKKPFLCEASFLYNIGFGQRGNV